MRSSRLAKMGPNPNSLAAFTAPGNTAAAALAAAPGNAAAPGIAAAAALAASITAALSWAERMFCTLV